MLQLASAPAHAARPPRGELQTSFGAGQLAVAVKLYSISLSRSVADSLSADMKLAVAVMYRDEDLSRVCQQKERVAFRVVPSGREGPLFILIERIFVLPFFSDFPVGRPAIDILVVDESSRNLRNEIARTVKLFARAAQYPENSFNPGFLWDSEALKRVTDAAVFDGGKGKRDRRKGVEGVSSKSLEDLRLLIDNARHSRAIRDTTLARSQPLGEATAGARGTAVSGTRVRRQQLLHEAQQLQRAEMKELRGKRLLAARRRTVRNLRAEFAQRDWGDAEQDEEEDEEEWVRRELERREQLRRQREAKTVLYGDEREAAAALRKIRARALEVSLAKQNASVSSWVKVTLFNEAGDEKDEEESAKHVSVFPELNVRGGNCTLRSLASFFLETSPEEVFTICPVPLFSPDCIFRTIGEFLRDSTSESSVGSVMWLRSPQYVCNNLLDAVLSRDISLARITDEIDPKDGDTLYWHLFSSCQCISACSVFAFIATNIAVELIEKQLFNISEDSLLIGSFPFDNPAPRVATRREKARQTSVDVKRQETLAERLETLQRRVARASDRTFHLVHLISLETRASQGDTLTEREQRDLEEWRELKRAEEGRRRLELYSKRSGEPEPFHDGGGMWVDDGLDRDLEDRDRFDDRPRGDGDRGERELTEAEEEERRARQGWKRVTPGAARTSGGMNAFNRLMRRKEGETLEEIRRRIDRTERERRAKAGECDRLDHVERKAIKRRKVLEALKRQWTGGDVELRLLPDGHPFHVFKLFKFDRMFMAKTAAEAVTSGGHLAILVLGDEEHSIEEASKLYGIEIQAQRMVNDAVVELKKWGNNQVCLKGVKTGTSKKGFTKKAESARNYRSVLQAHLMAAVDYKGFRVVVLPLPATLPKLLNWPQPVSSQLSQEVAFVEERLNLASVLKPQTWRVTAQPAELWMKTVLLSLDPSSDDSVVFYRLCFAFPQMARLNVDTSKSRLAFAGFETECEPKICERIRCNAFVHSRDFEMAMRHHQTTQQQEENRALTRLLQSVTATKNANASYWRDLQRPARDVSVNAYADPLVHSPSASMYDPRKALMNFLLGQKSTAYKETAEPSTAGPIPNRRARLLAVAVQTEILNKALAELECMAPFAPMDSISLTEFLHLRGINMRFLGLMIRGTRAAWLRHMLLTEVVARTLKRILKDTLRCLVFAARSYLQAAISRAQQGRLKGILKKPTFDPSGVDRDKRLFRRDSGSRDGKESDDDRPCSFGISSSDEWDTERCHDAPDEKKLKFSRGALLREAALNIPFDVATQLLDDLPYLLDLMAQKFRQFSWTDIVVLNLFNLTLGDSSESDEFWGSFLALKCNECFDVEAASISKSCISRAALYVAMQHHCGVSFLPGAGALNDMRPSAHPLQPSHLRMWLPALNRTLELPSRLPLLQLVTDPSRIPLSCQQDQQLVVSPSPSQILLAKMMGHMLVQCAVPLWRVWETVEKGLSTADLLALYVSTKAHPLLIRQDNWHLPNAVLDIVGCAVRFGVWQVARHLAERCLNLYPESHAAATQARLIIYLIELHGRGLPLSNPRLPAIIAAAGQAVKDHWEGTHPARLDILTYQAWHMHVSGDLEESALLLREALSLAGVMSGQRSYTDRQDVRKLLMLTSLSLRPFREQLQTTTPRQVTNVRMAGLLRLLARVKLLWLLECDQKQQLRAFSPPAYRLTLAREACNCLQWALDAYDFALGTSSLLTVGTAHELALAMVVLKEATRSDDSVYLVEIAAELAATALRVRTQLLGKEHVSTINSAVLLASLVAQQGKYVQSMSLMEAVIRNTVIRATRSPAKRRYRPDDSFAVALWCLPDTFFYGTFQRHDRHVQARALHATLIAHRKRRQMEAVEKVQKEKAKKKQKALALQLKRIARGEEGDAPGSEAEISSLDDAGDDDGLALTEDVLASEDRRAHKDPDAEVATITLAEQSRDCYVFETRQDEAPSDLLIPITTDVEETLVRIYINYGLDRAVERRLFSLFLTLDVLEKKGCQSIAATLARYQQASAGDGHQFLGYLNWLLDSSVSSDLQMLEYIQHYPHKLSLAQILHPDGDLSFALCHAAAPTEGSKYTTALDRYVKSLINRAQAAVFDVHVRLLMGEKPKLFVAKEIPSWKQKLIKAMKKIRCILVLRDAFSCAHIRGAAVRRLPDELNPAVARATKSLLSDEKFRQLFPYQVVEGAAINKIREKQSLQNGYSHMRTNIRLPLDLRSEALDMLASLLYHFMDVRIFRKRWERRLKDNRWAAPAEDEQAESGAGADLTEFEKSDAWGS
ncbi:hypothetical protein BESB_063710 [Besnoitia besnoiti]|uniref:CLU central domain-containing protein n=1 Tax=Besnoitia besnoiti TaxID=94643 RepID=A0A2A9ME62_BESBE|nr:hypothetical protein BESB_063710 [Besnoitia besnoiti]PFH35484.1 hypothetical protein BESB_063710 [Besnoitia besnoiti]